jgi:hypothetical protein
MSGLVYPNGEVLTREQILAKNAVRPQVEFLTPLHNAPQDFQWWTERMRSEQTRRKESIGTPEHVEITINTDKPVLLYSFGDVHAGGQDVDYDLFSRHIEIVRDMPNTYALAFGDLTDSFFFTPAVYDEIAIPDEQILYVQSAIRELNGKLLCAWNGDHDGWSSKIGASQYLNFEKQFNAHYLEGVSYVTLNIGGQPYKISGCHRHNGFSIYNNSHASTRLMRDDAEGADIAITAHMHQKAVNQQFIKQFGGKARDVTYASLGTYKETDSYSKKKGFHRKAREELGGVAMLLYPQARRIEPVLDLQVAAERLYQELR